MVSYRTISTAAFIVSAGVHTGILPFGWFMWHLPFLWRIPPQIWRFPTSFLVTGGGLNLLFDTYFLYTYLCQLEIGHPKFPRKEDMLWYLIFVSAVILVRNPPPSCAAVSMAVL
jgi:Derlin-2/3